MYPMVLRFDSDRVLYLSILESIFGSPNMRKTIGHLWLVLLARQADSAENLEIDR